MNHLCPPKNALIAIMIGVALCNAAATAETEWRSGPVTLRFGVETPTPDPNGLAIVDIWHTDVDFGLLGCGFGAVIGHDDPGAPAEGTLISPEDGLMVANSSARFNLPSIPPGFEFIGATPGENFWILPQTQDPSVLYLGLSSETMTPADRQNIALWNPNDPRAASAQRWLKIQLLDVRGPADGEFAVWQASGGPPTVFMSTAQGGVDDSDALFPLAGGHDHFNWGFTQPGYYDIDVEVITFLVHPRGDTNCNGAINATDFAELPLCITGPQPTELDIDCENWFDFDRDQDADLHDISAFQQAFTG